MNINYKKKYIKYRNRYNNLIQPNYGGMRFRGIRPNITKRPNMANKSNIQSFNSNNYYIIDSGLSFTFSLMCGSYSEKQKFKSNFPVKLKGEFIKYLYNRQLRPLNINAVNFEIIFNHNITNFYFKLSGSVPYLRQNPYNCQGDTRVSYATIEVISESIIQKVDPRTKMLTTTYIVNPDGEINKYKDIDI